MALQFCRAISKERFADDWQKMETYCVDWLASIDAATDAGSHKYIPTERLNGQLGLRQGAGVYGYRKYADGSYLLLTCDNGLAHWDGTEASPAFK